MGTTTNIHHVMRIEVGPATDLGEDTYVQRLAVVRARGLDTIGFDLFFTDPSMAAALEPNVEAAVEACSFVTLDIHDVSATTDKGSWTLSDSRTLVHKIEIDYGRGKYPETHRIVMFMEPVANGNGNTN